MEHWIKAFQMLQRIYQNFLHLFSFFQPLRKRKPHFWFWYIFSTCSSSLTCFINFILLGFNIFINFNSIMNLYFNLYKFKIWSIITFFWSGFWLSTLWLLVVIRLTLIWSLRLMMVLFRIFSWTSCETCWDILPNQISRFWYMLKYLFLLLIYSSMK